MRTATEIPLGIGYYSRADAARLLKVSPNRLSRWVRGYTYKLRQDGSELAEKRRIDPVVALVNVPPIENVLVLSFVELIELRVIKAFIEKGLPLQRIRLAAERAVKVFYTAHPFASRRVFTDGQSVFAELSSNDDMPDVIELTRGEHLQIHSGVLMRDYLDEVSFNEDTLLANRWWPLSKRFPIVLDPKLAFGAPVIDGTATRTEVVAAAARVMSMDAVAKMYDLQKRQVEAAVQFEDLLAA
jgi:uncharacterized protein (DUF433 family)